MIDNHAAPALNSGVPDHWADDVHPAGSDGTSPLSSAVEPCWGVPTPGKDQQSPQVAVTEYPVPDGFRFTELPDWVAPTCAVGSGTEGLGMLYSSETEPAVFVCIRHMDLGASIIAP
ncbi:hypothetical protein [Streptomyces sp. NPDC056056]|uniref:hypothetical protein n=1 Tax=Streptomyces sp. NPDC056056 TaxID=3345698 RepID=UPI0035DA3C89